MVGPDKLVIPGDRQLAIISREYCQHTARLYIHMVTLNHNSVTSELMSSSATSSPQNTCPTKANNTRLGHLHTCTCTVYIIFFPMCHNTHSLQYVAYIYIHVYTCIYLSVVEAGCSLPGVNSLTMRSAVHPLTLVLLPPSLPHHLPLPLLHTLPPLTTVHIARPTVMDS